MSHDALHWHCMAVLGKACAASGKQPRAITLHKVVGLLACLPLFPHPGCTAQAAEPGAGTDPVEATSSPTEPALTCMHGGHGCTVRTSPGGRQGAHTAFTARHARGLHVRNGAQAATPSRVQAGPCAMELHNGLQRPASPACQHPRKRVSLTCLPAPTQVSEPHLLASTHTSESASPGCQHPHK